MEDLKNQLNKSIKLAHLDLAQGEKKTLLADLGEILGFVQLIKKAEERGETTSFANDGGETNLSDNILPENREFPQIKKRNALREDIVESFDNVKGLIDEIPQKKDNLIKVKKI